MAIGLPHLLTTFGLVLFGTEGFLPYPYKQTFRFFTRRFAGWWCLPLFISRMSADASAGDILQDRESRADGISPRKCCPEFQVWQFSKLSLWYLQHSQSFGHRHVSVQVGAAFTAMSILVAHDLVVPVALHQTAGMAPSDIRLLGLGLVLAEHSSPSAHFININIITSRAPPSMGNWWERGTFQ